jgi:hypothetical protein
MATLAELRTEVLKGMGSRNDITASQANAWINAGLRQVAQAHTFVELEYEAPQAISGVTENNLPALARIDSILYLDSARAYELKRLSAMAYYKKFPDADIAVVSGIPEVYRTKNRTKFYAYPYALTGSFILFGSSYPARLTEDSDEPEIPYDQPVIYAAQYIGGQRMQMTKDYLDRCSYFYQLTLSEAIHEDNAFKQGQETELGQFELNDKIKDGAW